MCLKIDIITVCTPSVDRRGGVKAPFLGPLQKMVHEKFLSVFTLLAYEREFVLIHTFLLGSLFSCFIAYCIKIVCAGNRRQGGQVSTEYLVLKQQLSCSYIMMASSVCAGKIFFF